ncbi:MAG: hypothetical protein C0482_03675 [Gordonia sp.]|uniref:Integral membrane protein n=1 Tax=Gordonia rubripertincta TaxID=36822 RepID=A0ABT4MRK5_GORRU|nr:MULTISPECIES: hypothetical protein [Mycobacteriales]MBA4021438.1 hypothetical protein [Gordonia sp. (in: high G+C Gram-positive bacteria)]MCZ4549459.1 hypothetical protein [Gordonia rubripertincta]OZG30629.1 hypothetical protein BH683_003050 [Williamsia sp. 1138]
MDWYIKHVVDTGRSAALVALIGFVVTYGITRAITRKIKARSAAPPTEDADAGGAVNDIYIGGVHIHHQVWGILLILVAGLLEFRFQPDSPWREVLAAMFGIGAALALDEFALWLHLEDVYWSEEGRKSIDAVMIAAVVGLALLVGTSPIGVDEPGSNALGILAAAGSVVIHITYSVITLLKGKLATGLIGLPVPLLGFVGACRLAHPTSFWAKRFYSPKKIARAEKRYEKYVNRRERMRDLVGGRE